MPLDLYALSIILIGLAAGSFVKGLTGMGLPLVAVPILAAFLGAEHTIVVIQIPGLVSNAWLVWSQRQSRRNVKLRYDMVVPALIMVVAGVWFLDFADERIIILLLTGAVAVFLALLLLNPEFRLDGRMGRIVTPLASACGGFSQGATGVSAPLFSTLFLSFRLERQAYIYYSGLVFGLFNAIQICALLLFGMFTWQRTAEGVLALIPLFVFQFLGMKLMGRISQKIFMRAVIAVIVVMEIKLLWQGIAG